VTARVGLVNLGCAKNLVDSEIMMGLLDQAGFELLSDETQADVVVVNTCGFLLSAEQESVQRILALGEGGAKIVMAGCMVQRHREEVLEALPEVSAAIGSGDLKHIVKVVERVLDGERFSVISERPSYTYDEVLPRVQATMGPSAYLKISEGCDHQCAFCIIPKLRGPHRSRPIETIVAEARQLVGGGIKELVLIAQDSTRYGLDIYQRAALPELLRALNDQVEGLQWIRVHYAYPMYVNEAFLTALRELPKVAKYLDIPLQHASRDVLRRMRRPTNEWVGDLVDRIRAHVPGIVIRTSFIVGFPGETEAEFEELYQFVKDYRLDHVGVFVFSPEEGTTAFAHEKRVPKRIAQQRRSRLMALQQEVSQSIHDTLVGTQLTMLVEAVENKSGLLIGRSFRDAPDVDGTLFARCENFDVEAGDLIEVAITEAKPYDLHGVVVGTHVTA